MENLNHLVRHLAGNYLPVAVSNHSFFVNDIPANVAVENYGQMITSVISRMLSIVTGHVKNTCIRLSARKVGDLTVMEIKESGTVNSYALASDLQTVNLLAEQMGGRLSISIPKPEVTTISFAFPAPYSTAA